jgi:hypothetical protein
MGADPIRPRAARHAVMAAYYQIAGAAERSLSQPSSEGPVGLRGDGQGRSGNANPEKGKPSGPPEPPSSSLGSALAIFSVPGPTWPRPDGGVFFDTIVARLVITRALLQQPFTSALILFLHLGRSRVMHGDGITLRVAHLRQVTRSFRRID